MLTCVNGPNPRLRPGLGSTPESSFKTVITIIFMFDSGQWSTRPMTQV